MSAANRGGAAFPFVYDDKNQRHIHGGMTLRDYFAAKALQGMLEGAEIFWEGCAPLAYQYADAMLKARQS